MAEKEAVSREAKKKHSEMTPQLEGVVVALVNRVVMRDGKNKTESQMAEEIRLEMEKTYGTHWHCIIGRNFGSSISYDQKYFAHIEAGQMSVLVYRTN